MASVSKVILVGSLGRVSRDSLDAVGQRAFDRYVDALGGYGDAFEALAEKFADAVRRLASASRQLHELAKPFMIPKKITACSAPMFNRTAAFFHAAKVNARNLP
jgi:hypothetical protein